LATTLSIQTEAMWTKLRTIHSSALGYKIMDNWGSYVAHYKDGTTWIFAARHWREAWERATYHYPDLDKVETKKEAQ